MPGGLNDLDVSVALANDPDDAFIAELVDPNGQTRRLLDEHHDQQFRDRDSESDGQPLQGEPDGRPVVARRGMAQSRSPVTNSANPLPARSSSTK